MGKPRGLDTGDLLNDENANEGETDAGSEAEREEHGDRRGRHGEHDADDDGDGGRSWREDRLGDGDTE